MTTRRRKRSPASVRAGRRRCERQNACTHTCGIRFRRCVFPRCARCAFVGWLIWFASGPRLDNFPSHGTFSLIVLLAWPGGHCTSRALHRVPPTTALPSDQPQAAASTIRRKSLVSPMRTARTTRVVTATRSSTKYDVPHASDDERDELHATTAQTISRAVRRTGFRSSEQIPHFG